MIMDTIYFKNKPPFNQLFIQNLQELYDLSYINGDIMRGNIYKKALNNLMCYNENIMTLDDISKVKGIGKSTIEKFKELLETGKIDKLEKQKNSVLYKFTKIYGVGPRKAKELIEKHNINSLEELNENKHLLNDKQKIGLQYYYDILDRIPRKEIEDYEKVFEKIIKELNKNSGYESSFEIVGSYRRGCSNSGDIDIIFKNSCDDNNIIHEVCRELIKKNILIEKLSTGSTKIMLLCKLGLTNKVRRIDLMFSLNKEYPYGILYFTGNAVFNTLMRQQALDLGYTLNEHGISIIKNGKKCELLDLDIKNEKDIFDFLKMEYVEPNMRKGSNNIKYIEDLPINLYEKQGIKYLKKLTNNELDKLYIEASDNYYNSTIDTILDDSMFDILKDYIKEVNPTSNVLKTIGANICINKSKVKLPYFMGSMDKIKPDTDSLKKWKVKYKDDYVITAKLDGVSGLYELKENKEYLYTRGNGKYGQDISDFIKYFKENKVLPNMNEDVVIRGEFMISKVDFNNNYSLNSSNARNFVSGIINSKHVEYNKISNIKFIAYEVIKPILKPSQQIKFLEKNGFSVPEMKRLNNENLTNENLSNILEELRTNYKYEIDGLIITHNKIYKRLNKNPEHSIAFKMILTDQIVEAKVLDVIWNISKDGYLKPRVKIEPVKIGGALIEYATGFNGAFIKNNGVGFGSIVKLIRSGDVIPYIMEVIKPSKEPLMPTNIDYEWTSTNVDIVISKEYIDNNDDVKQKKIEQFFSKLGVIGLGPGNIKRIINGGFDTIEKIINMTIEDYLTINGFKEKMATKIYNSIKTAIDKVDILDLLSALSIFGRGFGTRKIKVILDNYPDYFSELYNKINKGSFIEEEEYKRIIKVPGFASKTAKQFVSNLDNCFNILKLLKLENKLINDKKDKIITSKNGKLKGYKIVISGFRSKELENIIITNGGELLNTIRKDTNILIVKDNTNETTKTLKAKKNNIPIYVIEEFVEKYDL
jgi:DNA ligase (NAD+)